jgi:hypothetical protein
MIRSKCASVETIPPKRAIMADQIVITEKASQARDVRAAVGSRYGEIVCTENSDSDVLMMQPADQGGLLHAQRGAGRPANPWVSPELF